MLLLTRGVTAVRIAEGVFRYSATKTQLAVTASLSLEQLLLFGLIISPSLSQFSTETGQLLSM